MRKESPRTRRNERDRMWYAHRLEGKVRNVGIKPKKKKKKGSRAALSQGKEKENRRS